VGIAAVIADGVGGHRGGGEVASQLRGGTALNALKEPRRKRSRKICCARFSTRPTNWSYDASMPDHKEGRMATTLTVSIFRNDEVTDWTRWGFKSLFDFAMGRCDA